MIIFREAAPDDSSSIALLHARSWQVHYRGIWPDAYLDQEVVANRLEVWHNRFQHPAPSQHIIVAEEGDELIGFACIFDQSDPEWGALLDNLHVIPGRQGKGVGATLLQKAAQWVHSRNASARLHLYVLEKNTRAIQFYDRMGGTRVKLESLENPGGGFSDAYLYVWTDLKKLFT